jgi:hypothetical protein
VASGEHPQGFIREQVFRSRGILALRRAERLIEDAHMLAEILRMEHPRFHTIIHIRREVGNFIGQIDQLRLQRRLLAKKIRAELRVFGRGVIP